MHNINSVTSLVISLYEIEINSDVLTLKVFSMMTEKACHFNFNKTKIKVFINWYSILSVFNGKIMTVLTKQNLMNLYGKI